MLRELGHQLSELRRFMGAEISKHVLGRIGSEVSGLIRREIVKALSAAGRDDGRGIVRMEFAAGDLRWADPDSLERRVLADWKERSAPKLRVAFPKDGELRAAPTVTVVDIRIPELGYRQHITDDAFAA